ncbi:MAG: hypothetical protein JNM84_02830 [Planctomycetes bacterium]|nr:hypothetical protein [Planctomycetota bacterium]
MEKVTRYGRIRYAGAEASRALMLEERFPPEPPPDLNRHRMDRRPRVAFMLARIMEAARFLAAQEQTAESESEGNAEECAAGRRET